MSPSSPSPLPRARREHLLRQLELRGSVRTADIAAELGVNEVTIRRDIIAMDHAGLLARVHGGALSIDAPPDPRPARSLIGLVLPGAGSHFPDIVHGAESSPAGRRSRIVLASTKYRAAAEVRQVDRLVQLGVDGLLIAPTLRDRRIEELVESLAAVPVPVVLIERSVEGQPELSGYDLVRTDQVRGTALALDHLVALGHSRIGLALLDRTPTAASIREGFAQGSVRHGLVPGPITSLPKDDGGADDPADRALRSFLETCLEGGVTAALVHTDFHASRLVEIAVDLGISVPDELAVVAYDDEFAELAIVPLTAVSPPGREIGRLAMHTLSERIRAEDSAAMPPRHIHLVPQLTIRRSCGATGSLDIPSAEQGAQRAAQRAAARTSTSAS